MIILPRHCACWDILLDAMLSVPQYNNQISTRCATSLCDEGAGSCALVPPGWWKSTDGLVVAGQAVDTGLDQNEAELAVLVLAVALEVLSDGDGLGTGCQMRSWLRKRSK